MSNQLAIASVTAALRTLLTPAVEIVPGARVTTLRPDSLGKGNQVRGVNLYLYLVTPNPSFRNDDLPVRRADGSVSTQPVAAVDLHYVVSAYGDDSRLEPQLLMGAVVARLHSRAILTGPVIEEGVTSAGDLLEGSDLASQANRVEIVPETLDPDLLHKMWSVLYQVPYQLSVVYRATGVLVRADETVVPRPPASELHVDAQPSLGAR